MSLPALPPGATLDEVGLPPLPPGATLDGGASFKTRGVRQPDGTWLVQTPDGPVRLEDEGNPVEAIHTPGGSQDVEGLSKEGVLNRVLATAQGGAQGFVPQLAGLKAAAEGGDYAKARDEARKTVNAATEEAGVGYQIAGGIASTAAAAPATIGGRLALSSGLGAVNAASESGGDLEEVAKGAGLGLVAGGVGEALGYGVRKVAGKVLGTGEQAIAAQTAKDAGAVEKEIASLTGQLGGETQKGSRLLENVDRFAAGRQSAAEATTGAEARAGLISQGVRDADLDYLREGMRSTKTLEAEYEKAISRGVSPDKIAESLAPVRLNVEADGSMTLADGRHRMAVARKFGSTSMPARIVEYDAAGNAVADSVHSVKLIPDPAGSLGDSLLVGAGTQAKMADTLRSPEARRLAEKVASSSAAKVPNQAATIEGLEAQLAARQEGAAAEAAKRTADYFATPVWTSEVLPRLKTLAPRFGLAATGAALGEAYDTVTGSQSHSGAFIGAVLGAPGVKAMVMNVARSNRVRVAVAKNLTPVLLSASSAIAKGFVPTALMLAQSTLHESALGDPGLAAEQLVARGGLASVLGDHPPDVGYLTGINAPQTPLDRAIHQTVGVTALAGALDAHHTEMDRAVKSFMSAESRVKPPARVAAPNEVHELAANLRALVDRLGNNLGSLHTVAPGVSASMAGVAQRAVQHLSSLSAVPPPKGPLATAWRPSAAERRILEQATAAIDNPLVLLEHAGAGTLTRAHINAAQAVYPTLTRAIGDRALDAAIGTDKRPSYRQRQMLSLLTGIDVDGSRSATAANQATIRAPSSKPSNAGMGGGSLGGSKGADKLTLGQRMAPDRRKGNE